MGRRWYFVFRNATPPTASCLLTVLWLLTSYQNEEYDITWRTSAETGNYGPKVRKIQTFGPIQWK